jgi:hypothetical protein
MTAEPATIGHRATMGDGPRAQDLARVGDRAGVGKAEVKAAFEAADRPARRLLEPAASDGKLDPSAPRLQEADDRQQALIDEGVEEMFPARAAVSVKPTT